MICQSKIISIYKSYTKKLCWKCLLVEITSTRRNNIRQWVALVDNILLNPKLTQEFVYVKHQKKLELYRNGLNPFLIFSGGHREKGCRCFFWTWLYVHAGHVTVVSDGEITHNSQTQKAYLLFRLMFTSQTDSFLLDPRVTRLPLCFEITFTHLILSHF